MKVIIAGSSNFDRGDLILQAVRKFKKTVGDITEIVSNQENGASMLGFNYAVIWNVPVKVFEPNPLDGKGAVFKCRSEMLNYADCVILFWDGKSKGTKEFMEMAKKKRKQVYTLTI